MPTVQISAHISQATKRDLERYAEAHGLKKGHLIEEALVHHLQALRELPDDIIVPVKLVLTPKSFAQVSGLVKRPRKPTAAMRALMKGTLKE